MNADAEASPTADDARARSRRTGKRVVLVVYGAFAVAFVALSTWQIVGGVFGLGVAPIDVSEPAGRECVQGVQSLAAALDRAMAGAVSAPDEATSVERFRGGLAPEWDRERAIESRCAENPRGTDAFAALRRLRLAEETYVRRQVVEIAPLRREVATYAPR